jgi:DNA-binding transcriptional MerR regulator
MPKNKMFHATAMPKRAQVALVRVLRGLEMSLKGCKEIAEMRNDLEADAAQELADHMASMQKNATALAEFLGNDCDEALDAEEV